MKFIVMCGGHGTKVWPASRKTTPKQFTIAAHGKSLFRSNIDTLLKKYDPKDILLATSAEQKKFLEEQAPEVPRKNYMLEPVYKNQGAATVFNVSRLYAIDPDEPFSIVQADVLRIPDQEYLKMLRAIDKIVTNEGKLVTGGIKERFARMGVDYIKLGKRLTKYKDVKAYEQEKFLGRSNYKKTAKLIKKGGVVSHANHLSWTPRLFVEALHKKVPEWGKTADKFIEIFSRNRHTQKEVFKVFGKMKEGPIEDLTKRIPSEIVVVSLPFDWIDFGTWESISQYMNAYEPKNGHADEVSIDSKGNFIRAPQNKVVATVGVENLAVIDTNDALLVCPLNRSGEVGEVIKKLKESGKEEYL